METNQINNLLSIATLTLPMIGVIIGAFLQYLFSKKSSSAKNFKEWETQAYIDFINAAAGINSAQRENNSEKEQEYLKRMVDAKTRICAYGNNTVISSIAEFWREGPVLTNPKEMRKCLNIIKAIRKTNKLLPIEDKNISQLLFSVDL